MQNKNENLRENSWQHVSHFIENGFRYDGLTGRRQKVNCLLRSATKISHKIGN